MPIWWPPGCPSEMGSDMQQRSPTWHWISSALWAPSACATCLRCLCASALACIRVILHLSALESGSRPRAQLQIFQIIGKLGECEEGWLVLKPSLHTRHSVIIEGICLRVFLWGVGGDYEVLKSPEALGANQLLTSAQAWPSRQPRASPQAHAWRVWWASPCRGTAFSETRSTQPRAWNPQGCVSVMGW